MEMKWINEVIKKLNSGQAFVIIIVFGILFLAGSFTIQYSVSNASASSEKEVVEKLDDISRNLFILRNGNNNNLSLSTAKYMCSSILNSARGNIIEDVHLIISHNHINDPRRQILIRSSLNHRINNYYVSDHSAMERMYYHGVQMSTIWDMFYPDEVSNNICDMLFDTVYVGDHTQLRIDINNLISNEFNKFNNIAIEELNKIK